MSRVKSQCLAIMLATHIINLVADLILTFKKKRFWLPDENRYVTLRISTRGMRIIDKKGIRKVINELRAKGKKI